MRGCFLQHKLHYSSSQVPNRVNMSGDVMCVAVWKSVLLRKAINIFDHFQYLDKKILPRRIFVVPLQAN